VTTPEELLETAVAAARAGGAKLIEGLTRPKEVVLKSSRASIVTWADEASQAAIVDLLLGAYPDHAVMGEEGNAGRVDGPYTWIVDPLDGTTNYARGLPLWGVSVAVRETDGDLVAGAVFDPLADELFSAARGRGVELAVSDTSELSAALVATGLQNDDPERIARFTRMIEALYISCRGVRALGSPALAMCYVAAGRLDAFTEKDATYAWDIAAATLLIEEAGGRVTDYDGTPPNLGPGQADVVSSNGAIHDELLAIVDLENSRLG
jgi:myo-inositol-1(or 4)-monophosphatase